MARHYTVTELKRIGDQCSNKLPPASAVQAMFLYEMQRETELESLFQGQLFRLAKTEDASVQYEKRMTQVEAGMKALVAEVVKLDLQRWVAARDEEARSSALMSDHTSVIKTCLGRLDEHADNLDRLAAKIDRAAPPAQQVPVAGATEQLTRLHTDIDLLFDERDALVDLLGQATARITKLEDLVRVLTVQKSSDDASPGLAQTLAVQAPDN